MNRDDLLSQVVNNQALQIVLDNVPLHIVVTDSDGSVVFANHEVEKITGYSKSEILGSKPSLWGRQMPFEFYQKFWHTIKIDKQVFTGIVRNKRKNSQIYSASVKVSPILDDQQEVIGFCGIEQDLTEIQEISDKFDLNNIYQQKLQSLLG